MFNLGPGQKCNCQQYSNRMKEKHSTVLNSAPCNPTQSNEKNGLLQVVSISALIYVRVCVRLTCICARFPAVMFEMVQQASLRIDSLALLRRCSRQGRAEQFNTTYDDGDAVHQKYTWLNVKCFMLFFLSC